MSVLPNAFSFFWLRCTENQVFRTYNDFKVVEAAAQKYSEASRVLVELQKDILVKANIPFKDHGEFIAAMP